MAAQIFADLAPFSLVYYLKIDHLCILKVSFGVAAQMMHFEKYLSGGRAVLRIFGGVFTRLLFRNRLIAYFEREFWGGRADDVS